MLITNDDGVVFEVRVIFPGGRYGRDNALVYPQPGNAYEQKRAKAGDVLVEFWDVQYNQFVARYFLSHLSGSGGAIMLDGGVPRWRISAMNRLDVVFYAEQARDAHFAKNPPR